MTEHCCHPPANKPDILLRVSGLSIIFLYLHLALFEASTHFALWYNTLALSVFDLVNTMWWGVTIGILMISVLARIPREFVISILGTRHGLTGILRATAAGVLLDLCSHGILMVGAKLYERGASIGQVTAFLIASPWNSFSLTLVLIALVGLWWTLGFIVMSMLIAIIVGLIFDALVTRGTLPANPQQIDLPDGFRFWASARQAIKETQFSAGFIGATLKNGIKESRMVMRWILFGVILASLIRAFINGTAGAGSGVAIEYNGSVRKRRSLVSFYYPGAR